jgi:hypothetical protein
MTRSNSPVHRAEAIFKEEVQARQGQEAMSEYQAEQQAMLDKTARLRALRLAKGKADIAEPASTKRRTSRRAKPGLHQGVRGRP